MSGWVLLIPSSESKALARPGAESYSKVRGNKKVDSFHQLNPHRRQVIAALHAALQRGTQLDVLLEATGPILMDAVRLNQNVEDSPAVPARDLYDGAMFDAIGLKSMKSSELKRFDTSVLMFSGLFGLVRPTDHIPPYRLKFGANLGGPVGKLLHFWRKPVSEILRHEVRGKVVWDFLPDQHKRLWDNTGEFAARHQIKFVKRVIRSGVAEYKTISHHSKSLKGALIRHLLRRNALDPSELHDFKHPDGYRYDEELSVNKANDSILVFAAN
ncbi:peroxide stress protein YaaA [Candidatus Sumerlaeota bacterium]|nr:peroxide stress protein YaaA [Candidatus Sumerlaeota bacterium]